MQVLEVLSASGLSIRAHGAAVNRALHKRMHSESSTTGSLGLQQSILGFAGISLNSTYTPWNAPFQPSCLHRDTRAESLRLGVDRSNVMLYLNAISQLISKGHFLCTQRGKEVVKVFF